MGTIQKLWKQNGLQGLLTYVKLKSRRVSSVRVPGSKNTVTLRKQTADIAVFKHIFVEEEYKFDLTFSPKFIIDAGANIGLSSIFFSQKFPQAKIIALEVEEGNFSVLLKNTNGYANIIAKKAGLWHKSAILEIANPDFQSTGFMVREVQAKNRDTFDSVSVNDLLSEYNQQTIDIIKIDVEGAEKEILSQHTNWLTVTKVVIIELHDRKKNGCSKAFLEAFSKLNFECRPFGQNFLMMNKDLI